MRLACTHNNCEGQWCANLHHLPALINGVGGYLAVGNNRDPGWQGPKAVSYTHLTLPTILRV